MSEVQVELKSRNIERRPSIFLGQINRWVILSFNDHRLYIPGMSGKLNQCCFNVGPASTTLAQRKSTLVYRLLFDVVVIAYDGGI